MEERQLILDPNTLKSINIDLKQAGKGVMNCIQNGLLCNLPGVVEGMIEIVHSIGFKKDLSYLAWQMVETAMLKTFIYLVNKYDRTGKPNSIVINMFNYCVKELLEEKVIYIDTCSFNDPANQPLLVFVINRLERYIHESDGFEKALYQDCFLSNFRLRFIMEINNEFSRHSSEYQCLNEFFNPRFIKEELAVKECCNYHKYLIGLLNYPLFGKSINLSEVYIQLRGIIYRKTEEIKSQDYLNLMNPYTWKKEICIVDIYLQEWVENGKKNDTLKIISGGPGYGKSTILKHLASILASKGKNVFFIPLYLLDLNNDIDLALTQYFKDESFFRSNPIDNAHKNILIFDGLDELSMLGNSHIEMVQSFLLKLKNKIELVNRSARKLLVIASGREIIVDQCRKVFEDEGRDCIIQLLPYYVSEELNKKEVLYKVNNNELLRQDQRKEWWSKFSSLIPIKEPRYIYDKKLEDLTSLPLLNCLLAMAIQNGLDCTKTTNLNEVYRELIFSVYAKKYPGDERKNPNSRISFEDFLAIMSEIAYCAWLNNGRSIDVYSVEKHLRKTKLFPIFETLYSDIKSGLNSLFVLFYFRKSELNNLRSQVFEFTHKSFTEYLTSLNISKTFMKLCKSYISDRSIKEKVIEKMKKLFYQKDAYHDIKEFISHEIEKGNDDRVINEFVILFIKDTFQNDAIKGYATINSFDSYYMVLEKFIFFLYSKIGKNILQKEQIYFKDSFRNFLYRRENDITISFLQIGDQDCIGEKINTYVFQSIDFISIRFKMIQMTDVLFWNSTFLDVTFSLSELEKSAIRTCKMQHGRFENIAFENLTINGSEFKDIRFENIRFSHSTIKDSIFDSCIFKNICYIGFLFSNCIFKNIDFTGVSFVTSYLISNELSANQFVDCKISTEQIGYIEKLSNDSVKLKAMGFEVV